MLKKPIEAVRIAWLALHTVYFDLLREDPNRVSVDARCSIREASFHISDAHELKVASLVDWLGSITEVPEDVVMPAEVAPGNANEGVGTMAYFHTLALLCRAIKPKQIVEFGTFLGLGTATMAMNCDAEILTIDLPDSSQAGENQSLNEADQLLVTHSRNRVGSFYAGKPISRRIREIRCDSRGLDLKQHVSSAELCLVDGGHSYECIRADTDNAFRVITPGGIIVWDDYSWLYPDVVRYLNEKARSGMTLVRIKGTNLVVHRT